MFMYKKTLKWNYYWFQMRDWQHQRRYFLTYIWFLKVIRYSSMNVQSDARGMWYTARKQHLKDFCIIFVQRRLFMQIQRFCVCNVDSIMSLFHLSFIWNWIFYVCVDASASTTTDVTELVCYYCLFASIKWWIKQDKIAVNWHINQLMNVNICLLNFGLVWKCLHAMLYKMGPEAK